MKRRRIPLLIAAVLAAGVLAALFITPARGPAEPVYDGQPLSAWIDQAFAPYTNAVRARPFVRDTNAEAAIRATGTNALPWLLHEFSRPARPWKDRLNGWVRARTGRPPLFPSELTRIRRARNGLNFLGTNLAPVLPQLTRWLGDPDRGYMVPVLLAQAGPAGLDGLRRAADDTNRFDSATRSNSLYLHTLFLQPHTSVVHAVPAETLRALRPNAPPPRAP